MKIAVIIFLISLSCLLDLSSCSTGPHSYPERNIDSISKSYCMYGLGDLWVYQLKDSSTVDSIVVTKITHDHVVGPEYDSHKLDVEYYQMLCESLNQLNTGLAGHFEISPCIECNNSFMTTVTFYTPCSFPIWVFLGTDKIGYNIEEFGVVADSSIELISNEDSLFVGGKWYKDVKVFRNYDLFSGCTSTEIVWAKGIGRIRIKTVDGEEWELKSYVPKFR
ncbi:MAG: hypothetical protein GC181_11600 [Bacteroidetes bacterium]|nr:hypothetical protein [Bacteroidota bacterium]